MEVTFEPAKNTANITVRGFSFERVADFQTAIFAQDDRHGYCETRYRGLEFQGLPPVFPKELPAAMGQDSCAMFRT